MPSKPSYSPTNTPTHVEDPDIVRTQSPKEKPQSLDSCNNSESEITPVKQEDISYSQEKMEGRSSKSSGEKKSVRKHSGSDRKMESTDEMQKQFQENNERIKQLEKTVELLNANINKKQKKRKDKRSSAGAGSSRDGFYGDPF